MIPKYLFILLALACSFACADVELLKVSGTENYTIKISKHVRQIDFEKFDDLLKFAERKKMKLHMNAVQLDLLGGDPTAAREIGKIIRNKKLNTYLAPKDNCLSACIYIAVSGVRRMIYGNVSVHRLALVYKELTNEQIASIIREHNRVSNQYLIDMGASVLLVEAINLTPNWGLRRLKDDEILHWGIFGADHIAEEILFREASARVGISTKEFDSAYVEHMEICKKEEFSFKNLLVDCTVNQLKLAKFNKQ